MEHTSDLMMALGKLKQDQSHKICDALSYKLQTRPDGSPIWTDVLCPSSATKDSKLLNYHKPYLEYHRKTVFIGVQA